jgi:hypothetical protein
MYKSIQKYQEFLKKQELEKETQLSNTSESVNEQMTKFMSKHGWERKGKGQKVKFTKKFNGMEVSTLVVYPSSYTTIQFPIV